MRLPDLNQSKPKPKPKPEKNFSSKKKPMENARISD